jgi:hypothetical protein
MVVSFAAHEYIHFFLRMSATDYMELAPMGRYTNQRVLHRQSIQSQH